MAAANKDRVYVTLYVRGGQDPNTYHRAITVGPKKEDERSRGHRYHVKQQSDETTINRMRWIYQPIEIPLVQTNMLLGRILIAKVTDGVQLRSTLAAVPIVQDNSAWTCRIWVRDVVTALEADGKSLGTRVTNWPTIEQTANIYIGQKRQQRRYDGTGSWKPNKVPTFDLLANKETTP
ncbi:hypothetical protein BJX99DRAFT_252554 [Aspergillus californicus]